MSGYVLRERAEADLRDIWIFTADRWSVEQADRYYRSIVEAFVKLSAQPDLGQPCEEVRAGYWRYKVGAHVIFYRVAEELEIVRVLHARRDFARHLPQA